jgi:hypothetical protein
MNEKSDRICQFTHLMGEVLPAKEVRYLVSYLDGMGFFDAPASTKFHGNYPGGLYDHSFMVTKSLLSLTRRMELRWSNPYSPYIVGMFHDLCKCDQYKATEDGKYEYVKNLPLNGHGDKSVILAQQLVTLDEEEILCIRWHMGAYETDTSLWNNYGAAIEKYPNVLWTHTADMMATRIFGV